jgi:tetratricopeptide (TPR) repeat protein
MKQILLFFILIFCGLLPDSSTAQTIDTIVNVGEGHHMHFKIIKGKGAPILFESGFGNGADVWKNITGQIAKVTNATIITYDRLTYGDNIKNYLISLETETKALEAGLLKLGYANKNIMLVAHSLGGMYSSYYASRHPVDVKAAVFIDEASVCSLNAHFKMVKLVPHDTIEQYLANVLSAVEKSPMPLNIPLTDIVADTHFDDEGSPDTIWLDCHKQFVAQSPVRKLLLAYNVGHTIYAENPPLVINAIITQYANFLAPKQKAIILEKGFQLALELDNETKKNEVKCGHSEDDLTTWGYSYLEKNETEKAIEVFKLNVIMNPEGWNTYDSLAEAYLKAGNKEEAIKNYKKSLELNPKNDNAIKILERLK